MKASKTNKWIKVLTSEVDGCHLIYHIDVSDDLRYLFQFLDGFAIDWPFSIGEIPESIRIIPLLSQLLPVAWVTGADIFVPVCDQDYYEALDAVRDGYRKMYPMMSFGGAIAVDHLVKNHRVEQPKKTIACYSGGVDSIDTILTHINETPFLVSIWGSDVFWAEEESWHNLEQQLTQNATMLGLNTITIRSSFRKFLNEGQLDGIVNPCGEGWWHGFQHGLGILGHMAPVAWKTGASIIYIASSFTEKDKHTCASDPTIDNYVRFCGARVIHDGYEKNRQQKIQEIVKYVNRTGKELRLHVCWEKRDGFNCCKCEKCWRTMLALAAENADPMQFGFTRYQGTEELRKKVEEDPFFLGKNRLSRYSPIQSRLRELTVEGNCPEDLKWLCEIELEGRDSNTEAKNEKTQTELSKPVKRSLIVYLRSWDLRKKVVNDFWHVYGQFHTGWRREYSKFITEYVLYEQGWAADCQLLYDIIIHEHPKECRFGGLHRHRWKYFFCRAFLGALPRPNYFGSAMYRHGWYYNRGIVTNGKIRFLSTHLNNDEATKLCNNKVASAEYWNRWYRRGWQAVGPGHPVTTESLKKLTNGKDRLILKPREDYGGNGIKIYNLNSPEEIEKTVREINCLDTPHILEEYVEQKGLLHDINPSSLNTLRVITVRHKDGSITPINIYVRFGHFGSLIDNVSSGGCEFYIDPKTGEIEEGDDFAGHWFTAHPDTNQEITGLFIPHFEKVMLLCREAHQAAPSGMNLAGWDVCVSDDQVLLIEVNNCPGTKVPPKGKPRLWDLMSKVMDEYYE